MLYVINSCCGPLINKTTRGNALPAGIWEYGKTVPF